MTVCGNRTDDPGFFTSCHAMGGCMCAAQVIADPPQPPDAEEVA